MEVQADQVLKNAKSILSTLLSIINVLFSLFLRILNP
jgi:hypothetical protein